jgi:hypothetical protein
MSCFSGSIQHRNVETVAVDLAIDAPLRIQHRNLGNVVETLGCSVPGEAEFARERFNRAGAGAEEIPFGISNAVLRGERMHCLRRIERLVEADGGDREAILP